MSQTKQQNSRASSTQAQPDSSKPVPAQQIQQLTVDQLLKKIQELGATASFLKAARKTLVG